MGKKGRKQKQYKRNQKPQIYLEPLSQQFKEQLFNEAILALSLLKQSKQVLVAKEAKVGYVLSKSWLEQWKTHVGYEEVSKDTEPKGKRYGRTPPGKINEDLVFKDYANDYHILPVEYTDYSYLSVPLREDFQPGKEYILVDDSCWNYFFDIYGGVELKRLSNQNGEFDLKTISPFVISLDLNINAEIQQLDESQLSHNTKLLNMKRLLVPASWDYEQFQIFVRIISNQSPEMEFRIWKIDSILSKDQITNAMIRSIFSKKYNIMGSIYEAEQISNLHLDQFLKNHYTLLVEWTNKEFYLNQSIKHATKGQIGNCEKCGKFQKTKCSCACNKAFYCSEQCRYDDQIFHSQLCEQAYDSEDDNDLEQIGLQSVKRQQDLGLVNLGNTCYMNSALQSLLSSQNLSNFLLSRGYYGQQNGKWSKDKQKLQLNFKFEKLYKLLHCVSNQNTPVAPISFRSQFCRVHPVFSGSHQMDAAEFISYLFDALNEEFLQFGKLINHVLSSQDDKLMDVDHVDENKIIKDQNSDSESDGSQDEDKKPQVQIQEQVMTYQEYQQKKHQITEYDSKDPENVWDNTILKNGQLMLKNFLGILQSEVKCYSCETVIKNYQPFNILPVPLNNHTELGIIEIYIVFADWSKPYAKSKLKFNQKQTILGELKLQISELYQLDVNYLQTCIANADYITEYLCDENTVTESIKPLNNDVGSYIVFFELLKENNQIEEHEIYFGVEMQFLEKKPFSNAEEIKGFSTPHLIIVNMTESPLEIYKTIFKHLGQNSNSEEFLKKLDLELNNSETQEIKNQNLMVWSDSKSLLGYTLQIQYKLPQKQKCLFTCQKLFKQIQNNHQCGLPINDSLKMQEYFSADKFYKTIVLTWNNNNPPQILRSRFDGLQRIKPKDPVESLESCIQSFQKREILAQENSYFCTICNDFTLAENQTTIYKSPDQLIIQLKRFNVDHFKGINKKINTVVSYEPKLNLLIAEKPVNYSLYGVILHFGSLENGHYMGLGKRNEVWQEFNDENVTQINEDQALNNQNAYILMYQVN